MFVSGRCEVTINQKKKKKKNESNMFLSVVVVVVVAVFVGRFVVWAAAV